MHAPSAHLECTRVKERSADRPRASSRSPLTDTAAYLDVLATSRRGSCGSRPVGLLTVAAAMARAVREFATRTSSTGCRATSRCGGSAVTSNTVVNRQTAGAAFVSLTVVRRETCREHAGRGDAERPKLRTVNDDHAVAPGKCIERGRELVEILRRGGPKGRGDQSQHVIRSLSCGRGEEAEPAVRHVQLGQGVAPVAGCAKPNAAGWSCRTGGQREPPDRERDGVRVRRQMTWHRSSQDSR